MSSNSQNCNCTIPNVPIFTNGGKTDICSNCNKKHVQLTYGQYKSTFGFESKSKDQQIKEKLVVLKDLLKECQDQNVKTWLRDKMNELLIEIL